MTEAPISFDDAPAPASGASCSRCHRGLSEYWTFDGAVLCRSCAESLREARSSGEGAVGRVGKALLFGSGGMLAGAAVWYGVAKVANLEVGYIAILLGWLVGKGIYVASGKRGGLGYQVMAIVLTYLGIGIAGVPFALEGWKEAQGQQVASSVVVDSTAPTAPDAESGMAAERAALDSSLATAKELESDAHSGPVAVLIGLGALLALAFMVPVFAIMGGQSVIGILIYGFAIWQAWRVTARTDPVISGPHPVAGAAN